MRKNITIAEDEKYLRQKSKKVKFSDKDLKQDIKDLEEYCLAHEVLAMAAIQIGIPKRIVYLKNTTLDLESYKDLSYNEAQILINPTVIKRKGLTKFWEACASCLNLAGLVERPYKIELEYYDENNNKQIKTFEGFESTVLSHELDHLDGILHIDKAIEILEMTKEERKEYRKTHPYEIISKTCNFEK